MTEPRDMTLHAGELAALIEAIEDYALILLGPGGEIRSWNTGAERTMGYRADEAIGQNFSRFYQPADIASQKPQNELVIAARDGRIEDEGWRVRKDGTLFWANSVITALRAPDGGVIGFAKVTRDLTLRRAAEEKLRQSEELFRLLVASVKDYAIFILDPQGHVMTWNAGAERIKGYKPEDIIGHHFSEFYGEEDNRNGKPQRELEIAKREGSVEDEGWRIRKDGSRFWALVVITAVYDDDGRLRGFAKVTRDMTERKRAEDMQQALFEQREARFRAEEERRRAETSYRVAQEANRAKDEFLMTLSHELRTPMTAVLGWSRLLTRLKPTDEAFHEAIAAIGRSAQLQARLIDDVLDVSRIVSGKLRLVPETIDLLQLLVTAVEGVRQSADAKQITLATSFAPELGTMIADATRLQQIVWNLLTNAVKFTPKHGAVTLAARRTSSHVQITVSDTGEGIDPAFLPHVFEPFRQAESPSTRVHGGLGLGLSIVRYLAEAHGGTVAVESAGKGKGTTFTVTLPIATAVVQDHTESRPKSMEAPEPIRQQLNEKTILLVDDDEEGRQVVRAVMRHAGASVVDVNSAAAALEELQKQTPDILVTDIAMPRMDGYALAREVRVRMPELKIVALTAFPAGRAGVQDSVFDAYITKPIEPGELVGRVAEVLAASK